MSVLQDINSTLRISPEETAAISKKQLNDVNSEAFKSFLQLAATKISNEAARIAHDARKRKSKMYVPYALTPEEKVSLTSWFPSFDIYYKIADHREAAMLRTMVMFAGEYMVNKSPTKHGQVVAYGSVLRQTVVRKRNWLHTCCSTEDLRVQQELMNEHDVIARLRNSAKLKERPYGLADEYLSKQYTPYCQFTATCTHKADFGYLVLDSVDVSFRQIAHYMNNHGTQLLYIAFPGNKVTEFCMSGEIPELGATVVPVNGGTHFDLVYGNACEATMRYTHKNHLELVARTEVIVGGRRFRKEFDNKIGGFLFYKITAFDDDGTRPDIPVYRSWEDSTYKNKYIAKIPVLKVGGVASSPKDWVVESFPVEKSVIDDVRDAALRAQGQKDLGGYIRQKLHSKLSNQVILNQMVTTHNLLAVTRFDLVVLLIYCEVFMQNFNSSKTVLTLAPEARRVGRLAGDSAEVVKDFAAMLATEAFRPMRALLYNIRAAYNQTFEDHVMPSYATQVGFTEYTSDASGNPTFTGWDSDDSRYDFDPKFPGFDGSVRPDGRHMTSAVVTHHTDFEKSLLAATGHAYIDENDEMRTNKCETWDLVKRVTGYFFDILDSQPDPTVVIESDPNLNAANDDKTDTTTFYEKRERVVVTHTAQVPLPGRNRMYTPKVDEMVDKVVQDNKNLTAPLPIHDQAIALQTAYDGEIIPGSVSRDPLEDFRSALEIVFPQAEIVDTRDVEANKHYGDMEYNIKTVRIKFDVSRLDAIKPESFFKPAIRVPMLPDNKATLLNSLKSLESRNANTPDNTDPLDEEILVNDAMRRYFEAYCVPDAEENLDKMDYIGPSDAAVRAWVSALKPEKLERLLKEGSFDLTDLDLANNALMPKGKVKPNMTPSYESALKYSQSIQYDQTGKSTAVLSPMIAAKVDREQAFLKNNVLVMQKKNKKHLIKFLNQFDHRPDKYGRRRLYLEGDYERYDKTQGRIAGKLHWRKLHKFGLLPDYVNFMELSNKRRKLSDMKSGVKAEIDEQRGSGHPNTLDGNNDVNMAALSELVLRLGEQIEFMIFMGDDFIIAVRGEVDVEGWEYEIARKFNLSLKLMIHDHGYMCSYEIVHLPNGETTVVSDPLKRALTLFAESNKDEELFEEKFTSYCDILKGVEDSRVQEYLRYAVPHRYKRIMPTVTPEAVDLLVRAHSTLITSFEKYRGMFSAQKYVKFY